MSTYPTGGPADRGPQPGQPGPNPGGPPGPLDALLAARQEVATLRDALEAIQDALHAAANRLDALEIQLGGTPPSRDDDDPALRPARSVAEWKMAGWTPAAAAGALVTGENLRARREALGISQAAVAHAAHCSRGLVAEVERGKRRSAQTLAHLSNTLDKLEHQARRN